MGNSHSVCVCVCVRACMCVCERERVCVCVFETHYYWEDAGLIVANPFSLVRKGVPWSYVHCGSVVLLSCLSSVVWRAKNPANKKKKVVGGGGGGRRGGSGQTLCCSDLDIGWCC